MIGSNQRIGFRKVMAAGAVALFLSAGGCDESGPLAAALDDATVKLNALAPGGSAPATPQYKARVLDGVIKSLKTHADRGTPSQHSAAMVIISQAQAGLAENPATEATEKQRAIFNLLTGIEATLGQWQDHNAAAEAARTYDPAPALAEIDAESRDREEQIQKEQVRKAEVDAAVQKLQAEAAAIAENAKSRRAAQTELTIQVAGESAVRGEELIRQGAAIGREADALEAQASDLEAQAAKIAPVSGEIALAIQRLTNQRALLDVSKAEILARAESYANAARATGALAAQDAADIDTLVQNLSGPASEELLKAHQDAVAGYEAAANTARQITKDPIAKGQAKLLEGSADQSLGDVHWSRAHAGARVIETLDALAAAKPPLPQAANYKTLVGKAREDRAEALDAATAAYQAAFNAYQAAGAKGEAQDRMEKVRDRLGKIVKATSGGKIDLLAEMSGGAASGDAPEETPTEAAEAPASDQSTVLGTLAMLIDSAKADDTSTFFDLFHASDDTQRALLDAVRPFAENWARLDKACKTKFGRGLEQVAVGQQMSRGMIAEQFKSLSASEFQVEESGDTATASHPGLPLPLKLVKVEGNWKFDVGALMAQVPGAAGNTGPTKQMQAAMGATMSKLGAAVEQVTADVQSGKITSIQAVQQALMQKISETMLGGARPPGGGGG